MYKLKLAKTLGLAFSCHLGLARVDTKPSPMPGGHDPATVAAVEDFLAAMSEIPAVAMDQDTAEVVLADVVDTLADKARDAEWGWVDCFCARGGMADIFAIFQLAGGSADERHGLLVRGALAFEAAQIALGHATVLDTVA